MLIRVIYNCIVAGSAEVGPPPALSLGAHAAPVGGEYRLEYTTSLLWLPAPWPLLVLLVPPFLSLLLLSYYLWTGMVLLLLDALYYRPVPDVRCLSGDSSSFVTSTLDLFRRQVVVSTGYNSTQSYFYTHNSTGHIFIWPQLDTAQL